MYTITDYFKVPWGDHEEHILLWSLFCDAVSVVKVIWHQVKWDHEWWASKD
jgi:hypothetical protein